MKVLHRKLLRDIKRTRGQVIAVALVIMCGAASYICMASAHRNLLLTRDAFYHEYRFADFEIKLDRAPTAAAYKLRTLPNVRRVHTRIVKDVNLDLAGVDAPRIGRVISMPDRNSPVLDDICLVWGRYFTGGSGNEVILSEAFANANALGPGDRIEAVLANKKHTLTVVGAAVSPEYVYMIRNAREFIANPTKFGILWVPETFAEMAFDMRSMCNNVVGMVEDTTRLDATLDQAEDALKSYGVFATVKAEDQISNRFLSDEIKGLEVSVRIVPTIFLTVAALALLVLLNRMVRMERTQIGLLKAYGHSSWAVSMHYVEYAVVLGLMGCAAGGALGQWVANELVEIYVEFFKFPVLRARAYPDVMAKALGMCMGFAVVGAVNAARRAARMQPAVAMRPPAPRYGHRTFLERSEAFWGRVPFTGKMILRNVARYRFRAALSVLGVAIASSLVLVGFFLMDAMEYLIRFQFNTVQKEDVRVLFESERGDDALREVAGFAHVRQAEPLLEYPFEMRYGWREKKAGIIGVPRSGTLLGLVDRSGASLDVGERGLVLSERMSEELGVLPGDTVTIEPLMGRVKQEHDVSVRTIARQYLGSSAYMDLSALSRLLDEPLVMNAALVRTERGKERELSRNLKDVGGVASVEIKRDVLAGIRETLERFMDINNVVLTLFSGIIAFAIIYNTTMVSLAERQRELASLRVMGFSTAEVGRILYNENFLLSALGLALGIPCGLLECMLIVKAYDTELYRLPFHIEPSTFAITCALTVVFVILANLAARRRVVRLDMIEVLKARE